MISRFATCCRALGLTVNDRQRPADADAARTGFAGLTRIAHDHCDAWTGLAAAGDVSGPVIDAVWRTRGSAGLLQREIELAAGDLGFTYDSGLYLRFRASEVDDFQLAYAARLAAEGRLAEADALVGELLARRPGWLNATWLRVAFNHHAQRWNDVVRLLTPVVTNPSLDEVTAHAVRTTLGIALARLGMLAPALSYLEDPSGPVAVAALDGALAKALTLRAQGEDEDAAEVLQDLFAAHPENKQVEEALLDSTFGLLITNAARIDARTDPWDPETEPSESDFVDPGAKERKAHLLVEAEAELAEFIGLEEVKFQVARLKSSVAMSIRRQERGLAVAQRTNHLVFAGPPGTGKTTIARVVAKIYCGLGLLKKETVREVHRADLIGQHIGETEAKTNAIIDSALDGVLFLDEAYALVSTGAKNDFGLVAIDTLLARMENDRDRLVVIVAGYRKDLDMFLDTNEGLRSRFTRSIDFPSYSSSELVEIAERMAEKRDSTFEKAAHDEMEKLFGHLAEATTPDAAGVPRRSLDIAGNGRFVRNLVERSEEEREYRLDHSDQDDFTDEEMMTITAGDVTNSAAPLLRGLGLTVPE
ncbi:type VII secretion AAA-ATPase EccA [Mycolicibacterium conceptionense]|uniref:Type VII secretion AAA-ATPase EccA n=1 Tax=Mycolicibacterium conceptionense TaxID=451644 RepID=A0A1A1YWD5_9MYCO|nr:MULTISPECIES: type VII secretion AAA-ATPase EccA [Mycolicibacterium]OBB08299.1 type VII secretion AAA-ATPase EccA [Mycolicibacterium conceptionense]OBE92530.1 type VII secretion AAA-ATPase EccA [Mycolicibacterium conceptionense]OBF16644.1 type VII secretion AAA-ATPase EccA [Mycolicibacterium conceptionense]OBF35632.1 type VII secretion AAA-ATPase EccA [Mycolicibacterium conceptionense]OBH98256.1 type VII secretion AAA-ATPase EccA [Mycolicibacterium conceptionense]